MNKAKHLQTTCTHQTNPQYNPRKVQKRHNVVKILLIMMVALSLAACGRRDELPDTNAYIYDEVGPRPGSTSAGDTNTSGDTDQEVDVQLTDRSQFYGETLTIFAQSRTNNNIGIIADEYMRLNPDVTIDVISFGGNLERAIRETSIALGEVMLPADAPPVTPPVLIESALVNPRNTHHFVNWLPFIYTTPDFDNYNFFINVIDAMTVDGYLYEFPITFSFNMVAANHTIPGLVEFMDVYENGITVYRLLELMRNFNTTGYHPYSDASHQRMYLWHNFDVGYGFKYLQDSFDSEDSTAEFNNQRFIHFLNHAREATYPDKVFGEIYAPLIQTVRSPDWAFVLWRYFFLNINVSDNHNIMHLFGNEPRNFIYAFAPLIFSELTPIVSNHGELILTGTSSYVLYSGATLVEQALAWDFMRFMASEEGARAASRSINSTERGFGIMRERLPMMNINRDAARFSVRANWPDPGVFCNFAAILTDTTYLGDDIPFTEWMDAIIDDAIPLMDDWMDTIGDMPMVLLQARPDAALFILQDFHNGVISAEEAAVFIQGLIEFEMAGT